MSSHVSMSSLLSTYPFYVISLPWIAVLYSAKWQHIKNKNRAYVVNLTKEPHLRAMYNIFHIVEHTVI